MEDRTLEQAVIGIQHPLENSLILDLVLGYFQPLATFQEWKSIRTVCKTWYFQTLAQWRATAFLNLKLGPTLHQNQPESPGVSMSEFLNIKENDNNGFFQFTEKPFQKYKLQNLTLDISNARARKNRLFWTIVGPNIRQLTLHEVNIKNLFNTIQIFLEFLVKQVPNLESFSLSNVCIDGTLMDRPPKRILVVHPNVKTLSILNCFAFGFAHFPNLKEVTLDSCAYQNMRYLVDSNTDMHWMLDTATNSSIERLKLENFDMLNYMCFNIKFTGLKHLSLDAKRSSEDTECCSKFIRDHAETLETIEAFGSLKIQPAYDLIIANLPNLTELRAWGNIVSVVNFTPNTPNLKLLHLDLYGFEKKEEMKEDLSVNSSKEVRYLTDKVGVGVQDTAWQSLSYFQVNVEMSKAGVENFLAKRMPNLKTLKTVLNKETFPLVCENWPELELLECMFGSSILNENITGTGAGSSCGGCKKALVDMENLTSFKLHTECNKSLLSDDSVRTGFLLVPKLTDLSICVSHEFSQDAEILVRRGIQRVQVYRNYTSNPLHTGWQCCRDTEYKNFIFKTQEAPERKRHSKKLVK